MRPLLQLKLGQHLTMTPQLQQAIRLLQLSRLDLNQEIQNLVNSNPLLELDDDQDYSDSKLDNFSETVMQSAEEKAHTEADFEEFVNQQDSDDKSQYEHDENSQWQEQMHSQHTGSADYDFLANQAPEQSLRDLLNWQKDLSKMTELQKQIATLIIDSISDEGYLLASMDDIQQSLGKQVSKHCIEATLAIVQDFEPLGIAARSLKECLLLQLNALPSLTPFIAHTRVLISFYLDLLAQKKISRLKARLKLDDTGLKACLKLLHSLDPKPGISFLGKKEEINIPDIIVSKKNEAWVVELNQEFSPKVRIQPSYAAMVKRADSSPDNQYIKDQLTEARWFLKSLANRNETLLRVATCIVERQKDFFESGETAMKPLILQDLAQNLSLHESTISRITTQKFMITPRGMYELKAFFSSQLPTAGGEACSSIAIRAFIKKIIQKENPKMPLSDDKIAQSLKISGMMVARRTVAKYREMLKIPASNERRTLL